MTLLDISSQLTISAATGGQPLGSDGPIIVLVHGAGMDRTVWSLQTRWLAYRGIAAIAIDLPGHGASPEGERSSIADYADWTASLVQALNRPVHLAGHSMGSFIAIECAVRTDLASLSLLGTAAAMPVHPVLLNAAEQNDPVASQLMSGWAFAPDKRTGPHPSPGASMVGTTQAMIAQQQPGVLHRDLAMCNDYTTAVESAAQVSCPTTLLLGERDRMTPTRAAKPLIDALANPNVQIAAGSGHMMMVEAPEFTRSVLADNVTTPA